MTQLLLQPRAKRLAALEQELQAAQAALRDSKPLATQHAQVEAQLRRLHKGHEGETSNSAQEALEQAQLVVTTQLAAVAESQLRIDEAKKTAADIASRMAAEFGAATTPTLHKFVPGSPEWDALGEMVRFAGNPEVQTALRSCGLDEGHLQSLNSSISAVHAAGAEQTRQAAESHVSAVTPNDSESRESVAGHRPAGTVDVVAQLVADGNAAQLAIVTRQLEQYKTQVAEMGTLCADIDLDMASDCESTATAADHDGTAKRQVKAKRQRKKLGDVLKVISSIGK